jgi:hypothetical protein
VHENAELGILITENPKTTCESYRYIVRSVDAYDHDLTQWDQLRTYVDNTTAVAANIERQMENNMGDERRSQLRARIELERGRIAWAMQIKGSKMEHHRSVTKFGNRLRIELIYWYVRVFLDFGAIHPKMVALRDIDWQLDAAFVETEDALRHIVDVFLAEENLDRDAWIEASMELQRTRARVLIESARIAHYRRITHQFSWF